jgi:hypothetical protein
MYNKTAKNATANPYETEALGQFGLGLVDYRPYRKGKDSVKLPDKQLLNSANKYFTASSKQNTDFYLARTGNALIYKERAELLKNPDNSRKRKDYLNRAIKEFERAKVIAAALKDTDSLKWLDRQILDLEFKKRGVREEKADGAAPPGNFVCP